MKVLKWVGLAALAPAAAFAATAVLPPSWAFYGRDDKPPGLVEPAGAQSVPGSKKTYTREEIDNFRGPPDWFPDEHPPMPQVVAKGGPGATLACSACHLASGMGHPESASLAGLTSDYIQQQLADYQSGARRNPVSVDGKPQDNSVQSMGDQAHDLSKADAKAAADYFAALKPIPWVKVVEATAVPKSWTDGRFMRLTLPEGGTEPLGQRIIELAQDQTRQLRRDPHSGTIAYVPPGSIAKGKALVDTFACEACHGAGLKGDLGPHLAGRSPLYVFRQLEVFTLGGRSSPDAAAMAATAAGLSEPDMIALAAYVGSLEP